MIRVATVADIPAIQALAVDTQMFPAEEVGWVEAMLPAALDGAMPDNHWLVMASEERVVGAAYYAPEPNTEAVWNVFFIAVDPASQGRGVGRQLMGHIEQTLRGRGVDEARVLLVETSSTEQYARTRAYYPKLGFEREATIRDYYGIGDDKVVFWKRLAP